MSKIVRFHETGDADALKIEELPLTEPSAGEVRLKVEAIGLNRAEVMFRNGQYLEEPVLPSRLGYEAAGIVDAVGSDVSDIQVGDRVSTVPAFSMGQHGVYGKSAIVPAYAVASYPEHLNAVEGASIWMQYLTAFGAFVELGQLTSNDTTLITAASSSVGLAAIQVSKASGAFTIATTRSAGKKQFLLDAGADAVIVSDDEDLAERVMELTEGKGASLIFDPIGGPIIGDLIAASATGAVVYEYGILSPEPTTVDLLPLLSKGLSIRGYTLFEIVQNPERIARGKQYIYDGLRSGALKPVMDRTFILDEIVDAHKHMESNQQKGKIVVTV